MKGMDVRATDCADISPPDAIPAGLLERDAATLIQTLLHRTFPGRIALVSSFGVDSAVLLHLVAAVDPAVPVIFVDTGRLFPETLAYRDALCVRLGLTDLRSTGPSAGLAAQVDPSGSLWQSAPDECCWHRKVEPLDEALQGFDAWMTGRKRFQGGMRGALPITEQDGARTKVNPLADWTPADIAAYRTAHVLPAHPLEPLGYRSIGCTPCTRPVALGEAPRAGRWAGRAKTECGIHLPRSASSHQPQTLAASGLGRPAGAGT